MNSAVKLRASSPLSAVHCNHDHNTQRNFSPMRVLLVEDDDLIGCGVEAGLRQAGFTVDWARDGHKAGLALDTTSYALVVLDLGLPRVSGMDLLKRIRDAGNDVPVLVLTARGTVVDRVSGSGGRRGRLPRQALRPHGTDGPLPRLAAPRAGPQRRADPLWRSHGEPRGANGPACRHAGAAHVARMGNPAAIADQPGHSAVAFAS